MYNIRKEDSPGQRILKEYYIANSFEEFLSELKFYVDWLEPIYECSIEELKRNLERLEEQWGIQFPLQYKKLVFTANGGYPEYRHFYHEKGKESVDSLLRVDRLNLEDSVLTVYQKYFEGSRYYPFAKCSSGRYLWHDYGGEKPTVILWDPDGNVYKVKTSFSRFLHYLSP